MVTPAHPSVASRDTGKVAADAGQGLNRAARGTTALYLGAEKKTLFLRLAFDKYVGRRVAQHHGARVAIELLVRNVEADGVLKRRGDVRGAIPGLEDILTRAFMTHP